MPDGNVLHNPQPPPVIKIYAQIPEHNGLPESNAVILDESKRQLLSLATDCGMLIDNCSIEDRAIELTVQATKSQLEQFEMSVAKSIMIVHEQCSGGTEHEECVETNP